MAVAGVGIIGLVEKWLQPHIKAGRFVPALPDWWSSVSSRRSFAIWLPPRVPPSLRSFLDFIRSVEHQADHASMMPPGS